MTFFFFYGALIRSIKQHCLTLSFIHFFSSLRISTRTNRWLFTRNSRWSAKPSIYGEKKKVITIKNTNRKVYSIEIVNSLFFLDFGREKKYAMLFCRVLFCLQRFIDFGVFCFRSIRKFEKRQPNNLYMTFALNTNTVYREHVIYYSILLSLIQ